MIVIHTIQHRTPLNKRQLEGALNRVPPDFYSKGLHLSVDWLGHVYCFQFQF